MRKLTSEALPADGTIELTSSPAHVAQFLAGLDRLGIPYRLTPASPDGPSPVTLSPLTLRLLAELYPPEPRP